jgi:nicotinamide-nucleotide amidase
MHAEIVSIGTELLMGEIVDTNSAYLASELAKLGIELRWVTKVGDDPERLFEVISRAWQRSDVTLTSGGLGPTSDDLTRESIASVFGEEMTVQEDLLEHLRGLFANRGFPMPENNVKQATLIPSAQAIPNPMGTAPGWWAEKNGHVIVAMPGPPREIQRMWTYEVAPRLKECNPSVCIVTRNLKTFGISEGGLDQMLSPLFTSKNPLLGIYSKQDGIHLRAIATAPTEAEARRLIEPMEAEIRRIIGDDVIWGLDDETPELQTAALLRERGLTLGVMESFTGGLLASNLAEVEGSLEFMKGSIVVYRDDLLEGNGVDPDLVRRFGPVNAQIAEDMARAARKLFDTDVGIGVTGLVREPTAASGPIGTSYIGFAYGSQTSSVSGYYPTHRLRIRSRAVTHALIGLIRFLRGQTSEGHIWRR